MIGRGSLVSVAHLRASREVLGPHVARAPEHTQGAAPTFNVRYSGNLIASYTPSAGR